jgi:hypothetical protein
LAVEVNRSRRQLTFQQRAKLAVDLYNALAKEGRGGDHGNQYVSKNQQVCQKATGSLLAQDENQYTVRNQEVSRKATGSLSAQDEKPNILNAILESRKRRAWPRSQQSKITAFYP